MRPRKNTVHLLQIARGQLPKSYDAGPLQAWGDGTPPTSSGGLLGTAMLLCAAREAEHPCPCTYLLLCL